MSPDEGRRLRAQRGETLIESLIAISLLSLVAIVAFQGLSVSAKTTADHRDQAIAETLLRSAAENIQSAEQKYELLAGCPGAGQYSLPPITPALEARGFSYLPIDVRFWNSGTSEAPVTALATDSSEDFSEDDDCPPSDPGLQSIRIGVDTPTGSEQLVFMKRKT